MNKIQSKVMKLAHEIKNQFENFAKALKYAWGVIKGIIKPAEPKANLQINLQKHELKQVYFTEKKDMPQILKEKLGKFTDIYLYKYNTWERNTKKIINSLIKLNKNCALILELIDSEWHITSPDNFKFKAILRAF